MKKEQIFEILEEVGLTEGERKVYLELLKLKSSSTGPIVKASKVHASKIYSILDRLIEKGMVSYIKRDKKIIYSANRPENILTYLERKEFELKELKDTAKDMIKDLSAYVENTPSDAKIYLGMKGVQIANENIYSKLEKGDTYYILGIPAFQPDLMHAYWKKDHKRRSDVGMNVKLLFNKGTPKEVMKNRNSFKGTDARYMPTDIETPALFGIYKDVVQIMLQSPEYIMVEITNQHIANSFKAYFDEFWSKSKKFS